MQREVGELVRGFGKHLELIADVIDHDRAADAATEAARVRAFFHENTTLHLLSP
jgi:hypothetical protein